VVYSHCCRSMPYVLTYKFSWKGNLSQRPLQLLEGVCSSGRNSERKNFYPHGVLKTDTVTSPSLVRLSRYPTLWPEFRWFRSEWLALKMARGFLRRLVSQLQINEQKIPDQHRVQPLSNNMRLGCFLGYIGTTFYQGQESARRPRRCSTSFTSWTLG